MGVKPLYAVGLDLGSRKTRMVICALEDRRIRFLGCSTVESQGWIKGRIVDQMAVADSVLTALREVEAMVGVSVGSAVVGMGGQTLRGANGRGVVELGLFLEIQQRHGTPVVHRTSRVQ